MGFGFSFLFLLVVLPATLILAVLWSIFKQPLYGKLIGCIWFPVLGLIFFHIVWNFYTAKKRITEEDLFGNYVIDRTQCPGHQAEWQYNHYRFTLESPNIFIFELTERQEIVKQIEGVVRFGDSFGKPTLIVRVDTPTFHIIQPFPTRFGSYEDDFYFVFESPKYGNVFFKKGEWEDSED